MIDYEEARALVLKHAAVRATERVSTYDWQAAQGCVLAEDVVARIASPPFDKAAMDGYAVRQEDVKELPAELKVVGEVFAGRHPHFSVGPGQAAAIATGAPVPTGADMVVMVEHTERTDQGRARVRTLSGANICPTGEDVQAGQTVLKAGQVLTAMRLGVAAAAGYADLSVYGRPTGALLCTGNEVVEPDEAAPEGKIFNANGSMLSALMGPRCGRLTYLGIVGDDEEQLTAKMRKGLESDVLVISGGVSVGQLDLVPAVLQKVGVKRVFHRVAIKPGKPVFFGSAGRSVVFGMPGNPQSCFVIFHMLVAPALAAMSGATELPPFFEEGVVVEGFKNKPGRMTVMPCTVERRDGINALRRHTYHGSADIVGPSAANGYLVVPPGTEQVREGEKLRFFTV